MKKTKILKSELLKNRMVKSLKNKVDKERAKQLKAAG